jgi:hypothetical protein
MLLVDRRSYLLIGVWMWLTSAGWCEEIDAGRVEYLANCAGCHGEDGKGQGPLAARFAPKPPDLTVIVRKNRGVFPTAKVYQQIDGRTTPHRRSEMPVWGCRYGSPPPPTARRTFRPRPTESHLDLSCDPEPVIRKRILSILGHLDRIQQR